MFELVSLGRLSNVNVVEPSNDPVEVHVTRIELGAIGAIQK